MIVRFALEPEALKWRGGDRVATDNFHVSFLEKWHDCGVLIVQRSHDGASRLDREIQDLPLKLRKRWTVAMGHFPRVTDLEGLPDLSAVDHAEKVAGFAKRVQLVLFEPTRAFDAFGLTDDEVAIRVESSGLEVCRFDAGARAASFAVAKARAHRDIPAKEATDAIWREYFEIPVALSKTIVVIDRYSGKAVLERGERSGFGQFLKRAEESVVEGGPATHEVIIYSEIPGTSTRGDIHAAFRSVVASTSHKRIQRVTLRLLVPGDAKKWAHDRKTLFDRRWLISLGSGIRIFEGDRTSGDHDIHCHSEVDTFLEGESRLREQSEDPLEC
jgi:hypothetical protein